MTIIVSTQIDRVISIHAMDSLLPIVFNEIAALLLGSSKVLCLSVQYDKIMMPHVNNGAFAVFIF